MIAPDFLHSPRPALPVDRVIAVLADIWGIDGPARDVGGDRDQNLVVTTADDTRYLVKIAQSGEVPGVLDLQIASLLHIAGQAPDLPVPRVIHTRGGERTHGLPAADGGEHIMRVFSFLPGRPILDAERPPRLMHGIGRLLARVDLALQGFFHPHAGHALLWDPRQAPAVRDCTVDIVDTERRQTIEGVIDHFCHNVLPGLDGLPAQVIHGDATAENVLVDAASPGAAGLIDFGDVLHAPRAMEVAIAMADATWGAEAPWEAACELAAGYDEVLALGDDEIAVLYDLARVRLAACAAIMATRGRHRQEGMGSMTALVEPGWRQLSALNALGPVAAHEQLRRVLRLPAGRVAPSTPTTQALERRRQALMPGLELFYPDAPLHVERGSGVWLYDRAGERYLDCYNNVPHVGHAHPHVNRAVARQTATLNTHTRYLFDSILDYAEALGTRMPGNLGVALFVNSGSEAIDLAWQIARHYTGHEGALVTAHAYHGGTEASAALSPYSHPAAHVAGLAVATERDAAAPASDPDAAIARLAAAGHRPAAFFVDSSLSSDGILDPAPGFLHHVSERVRAGGGLCVADEVQAGFGRMGRWWGFEARGFTPDIVTLGKPMANGYPMGAVITTPEIIAPFAEGTDYFSTFGGNPVACMAGLAVLDVIEREDLCASAEQVGARLRHGLRALKTRYPVIGAVRGRGLFIGVTIVDPDAGGTPAPARAHRVALALRRRHVLVGLEGPDRNVLKIRPPLAFHHEHASLLVQRLASVLDEDMP